MLTVSIEDGSVAALATLPEQVRDALMQKAAALAALLQANIARKLSGDVLNARTGALARSIIALMQTGDTSIAVSIGPSGDIKYAGIHEHGGTIPPHAIVPNKAKALAFAVAGKHVFAARVDLPAITMPERSYLRAALAELADEIKDELSAAVIAALR